MNANNTVQLVNTVHGGTKKAQKRVLIINNEFKDSKHED